MRELPGIELVERLNDPLGGGLDDEFGRLLVAPLDDVAPPPLDAATRRLRPLPFVVLGVGEGPSVAAWEPLLDVVVAPGDPRLDAVVRNVARCPIAATTLALLLRESTSRTVEDAIVAESAAYSALQAGPEFATWRASRPVERRPPSDHAVRAVREGATLHVTLSRPAVRNALDAQMRDELAEALRLADADETITRIVLDGDGDAFCSGGDLDEFGSRPDPATAHLVRLARSPALLLARMGARVVAHLHGACYGSGIELPAFAARVVARDDTRIALPEIGLGLIPGAGGSASIVNRIGRHRTALLALSTEPIDAETALDWGLVDEIGAPPPS